MLNSITQYHVFDIALYQIAPQMIWFFSVETKPSVQIYGINMEYSEETTKMCLQICANLWGDCVQLTLIAKNMHSYLIEFDVFFSSKILSVNVNENENTDANQL